MPWAFIQRIGIRKRKLTTTRSTLMRHSLWYCGRLESSNAEVAFVRANFTAGRGHIPFSKRERTRLTRDGRHEVTVPAAKNERCELRTLRKMGWRAVRIWECQLARKKQNRVLRRLRLAVSSHARLIHPIKRHRKESRKSEVRRRKELRGRIGVRQQILTSLR
jgi:hypothetical protein